MSRPSNEPARPRRLAAPDGLSIELNANGSVRHMRCGDIALNLFVGNELEGGPANLYLRRPGDSVAFTPLLGPRSPTQWSSNEESGAVSGTGIWQGLRYVLALRLTASSTWIWQL